MTNVTSEQYKSYFNELPPALSNAGGQTTNIQSTNSSQPTSVVSTDTSSLLAQNNVQQQELMIREFSAKSNLNIEWSKQ